MILRHWILSYRLFSDPCPVGTYYDDEVSEARLHERAWSQHLIEMGLDAIEQWLSLGAYIDPRDAYALSVRGVAPEDLLLRLWSGVVHPSGLTLFERIECGNVDAVGAANELQQWRARGCPRWRAIA